MREVIGACPLDCPDACSWVVTLDAEGRATRLRGNENHPYTRGGLCAKVNPYLEYAASPDRLLHPLRRVGAKGEGRFERVSWDEALEEAATRIRAAIDRHGGEAVWPFPGTGSVSVLQGLDGAGYRLFHALGASTPDVNICSSAGGAGLRLTTGTPMGMVPQDLAHSGIVVLWGTNTLTTNLHLWPFVRQARERGAPVVVVDPVRTRTAAQADRHLAPRPGTDAALALGVMARLVECGATDEGYLAAHTLGWDRFRGEVLAQWSPARAAQVCGLDESEVTWFADAIADHRPLGLRSMMGMQRHGGGAQALRTVSCLPAVTGAFAHRGGGIAYSTGRAYGLDEDALMRPDLQPHGPTRTLRMTDLGRDLLERTDPPVEVLVVWGANPAVSNPDQNLTRRGLAREDLFTVVVEHTLTDTARYADLVLPGTMQVEHDDLVSSYGHLYLHWNHAAVPPPGECLPHTEIFRRLARALGITDPAVLASDDDLAAAALGPAPSLAGITVESLKERGWQRLALPEAYLPFADGFPTPSGRFEFVSARAAAQGLGELPGWTPPHEPVSGVTDGDADGGPDDGEWLMLVSPANHWTVSSTFAGSPLHRKAGPPVVHLHPKDAADRGLAHGDAVEVSNARGAFTATVSVGDVARRGVAVTTKGLLPDPVTGTSVNATTSGALTDAGGGATFHDNRVRVLPMGPRGGAATDGAARDGAARDGAAFVEGERRARTVSV